MEGENQEIPLGNDVGVVIQPVFPMEQVEIFLGMFEEIALTGDLSPVLLATLQRFGFGSRQALRGMPGMSALIAPECIIGWSTAFNADRANAGAAFLRMTVEEYGASYLPGGANYVGVQVPVVGQVQGVFGGGLGLGAAVAAAAGAPGVPAAAIGTAQGISGSKARSTATITKDRDGNEFLSNHPGRAPELIEDYQHLLRIFGDVRKKDMLGPETNFTSKKLMDFIRLQVKKFRDSKHIDPEWDSVKRFDLVSNFHVLSSTEKFDQLVGFKWEAQFPYRLSIGDFLAEGFSLEEGCRDATASGRRLIFLALGNVAVVFSIILGGTEAEYLQCLEPMIALLRDEQLKVVPVTWICHRINLAFEYVMRQYRTESPLVSDPTRFTSAGSFQRDLLAEMIDAAGRMPINDATSTSISNHLSIGYYEIEFVKPGGKGSSGSASSSSSTTAGAALSPGDDLTPEERARRKKRNKDREERRKSAAQKKLSGGGGASAHSGDSPPDTKKLKSSQSGGGNSKVSGSDGKTSNSTSSGLCFNHLCRLLEVTDSSTSSSVIKCNLPYLTNTTKCAKGFHPAGLQFVRSEQAKSTIQTHAKLTLLTRAMAGYETAKLEGKFMSS